MLVENRSKSICYHNTAMSRTDGRTDRRLAVSQYRSLRSIAG